MRLALASDHAGFEALAQLQSYLESLDHQCYNYGPKSFRADDDYPDFVGSAAAAVASGECQAGVILGGSGQGEAMAANRLANVRCAVFYGTAVARRPIDAAGHTSRDPYEILKLSRQHNDANMLSLAARFLSLEEMKQAVKLWLETPFSNEPSHLRRIAKLGSPQ
ncbi:RpiB/LacA/LacB family sugar-phosphate isomerase [Candidatus Saccharibacteria bacterium]|nr:RpiB/LacA/LacB family sugar-phosphate isomerase [Candidatus Saccharibacteria bacterium]